jgi:hypothetical protein
MGSVTSDATRCPIRRSRNRATRSSGSPVARSAVRTCTWCGERSRTWCESTVLGHEAVGVVEETGPAVRGFSRGDRVVVTSTIGCGTCSYCRAGYYAQCDTANPNGPSAGTAQFRSFPIGAAMNKNLTVKMGHLQPTPIPARPARPRGRGHDRPHRVHHPA